MNALSTGGCFATTASPTISWQPSRGCIFFGRHSRLAFVVEVPSRIFLFFVCGFGIPPVILD
jgi:hypothetical protein